MGIFIHNGQSVLLHGSEEHLRLINSGDIVKWTTLKVRKGSTVKMKETRDYAWGFDDGGFGESMVDMLGTTRKVENISPAGTSVSFEGNEFVLTNYMYSLADIEKVIKY